MQRRVLGLTCTRSRSLSELTTLQEEDPYELRIEDGLPQTVVETIDQAVPGYGDLPPPMELPAVVDSDSASLVCDPLTGMTTGSRSAPHILGRLSEKINNGTTRI